MTTEFDPVKDHPRAYAKALEVASLLSNLDEAFAYMFRAGYRDAKRSEQKQRGQMQAKQKDPACTGFPFCADSTTCDHT